MRTVKYLRDARHLEKGLYALTNELFYEPFEGHYEPSPEYLTLVRDLLKGMAAKWLIGRNGLWYHAHPVGHRLPMQGWKIHVSATIENGPSILGRAARIAGANGVSFKFALDRKVLAMMSSKSWHRGRSGKFITMYPEDLSCFKNLMEQLYAELREDHGPYILSDKRYKDCRVLYYRYGGVERNTELDITGEKILVMVSPSGETMRDVRSSYFNLPPWETDPFPTEKAPPRELTLNAGRYLVKKALGFSNSGGVYLVEDRHTGADVVVKEARAHTAMDGPGSDAIQRLKKEEQIFELLRDTHITPAPVESFQDWEHFFLAEEFVSGRDIRELMLTRSPLMRVNPTLKDTTEFYETFRTLFKNFVQALEILHQNGVVLGDLSASNIKIDPSTYAVRLIDFEGAFRPGVDVPTNLYTPGFRNPLHENKKIQNFEDDLYGMAAIMFYIMFPIPTLSAQRPDLFQTVLPIVLKDIGWEQTEVSSIISGLAKNEITCARVRELLDRPAQIQPPGYAADIESDSCNKLAQELGSFI
ncbi:MAG TPA: membrane translocator, partial [Candidatus Angelobacter sp.]|nr:membrane translocator [Candidatus Angelobacter sp.]